MNEYPPSRFERMHSIALRTRTQRAFSLVEVVLALGVFSFAVLSVVGTLGVGLDSVSTSNNSFALANITRTLRANYQSATYNTVVDTTTLGSAPSYFTAAGYATTLAKAANTNDPIYYAVTCTSTKTNGTSTSLGASTSLVSSQNAAVVTVSVSYPYPANARTSTFSLFLAQ